MLQEIERQTSFQHRERETMVHCDTVIVGSGITGLLLAKKLSDLGQSIILVDSNSKLAFGASIKNHGWLHRGTVHAVSIPDKTQAKNVVQKLIYGHEFIKSYAGECIEDPFEPIYVTTDEALTAQRAVELWKEFGVDYEEISREVFYEKDELINQDSSSYFFKSSDLKINNRILFQKLLSDIKRNQGMVVPMADIRLTDSKTMSVLTHERKLGIRAEAFVYCTGAVLDQTYQKVTGSSLNISFWKSHLLYLPRFNPYSVVSLDKDGPIIINHREMSVINRGYDEMSCTQGDYTVDQSQVASSFSSLRKKYPIVVELRDRLRFIACIKPSIKTINDQRHSVESNILEPVPGHYFVLPGKMTEAPYVVDELIHAIYQKLDFSEISQRPIDEFSAHESFSKNIHLPQSA